MQQKPHKGRHNWQTPLLPPQKKPRWRELLHQPVLLRDIERKQLLHQLPLQQMKRRWHVLLHQLVLSGDIKLLHQPPLKGTQDPTGDRRCGRHLHLLRLDGMELQIQDRLRRRHLRHLDHLRDGPV